MSGKLILVSEAERKDLHALAFLLTQVKIKRLFLPLVALPLVINP